MNESKQVEVEKIALGIKIEHLLKEFSDSTGVVVDSIHSRPSSRLDGHMPFMYLVKIELDS